MLEFEDLLEQQANVESFAAWLNSVVERCVVKVRAIFFLGTVGALVFSFLVPSLVSCGGERISLYAFQSIADSRKEGL